ncbi:5'-methylthioadenosine/S-adenosylhomocysteine nucleosidase [Dictyobacter arantiisoli]|uniref:Nucleoside phosphorylase domain-containing protein n=1 Tax=Dictyobacter arantiisoli TaxID=2014874 RepID=A0A5A5T9I4_9CHLR|nr:5'-methylthioadenosine/S-adenosylhomocysteine nucleosidase [Dictyobacter arantiisoli]GCF07574.1 hypothetical protein KDI_11380 [Dictyobacter arantiisoli]
MTLFVVTPLLVELDALTEGLVRRGFEKQDIQVGKLPVRFFAELNLALAVGGLGKSQCAVQTQHLIDNYKHVDGVICAGAAGALAQEIAVGDLVVARETVEHDFKHKFIKSPLPRFTASPDILAQLEQKAFSTTNFTVHYGNMASGDEDIIETERAQEIRALTDAIGVAWEGAGVARACLFSQIPFLEIRGISDTANHDAPADFLSNVGLAMDNLAALLVNLRS